MIRSFACRETERIWAGYSARSFPHNIQTRAFNKLRQLNTATILDDLKQPPGNRLEFLKGDKKEYMSIRINNQWRLCFLWEDGDAYDVKIIDYH